MAMVFSSPKLSNSAFLSPSSSQSHNHIHSHSQSLAITPTFRRASSLGASVVCRRLRRLPGALSPRAMSSSSIVDLVKSKNDQNPVVVYSKTWCPYCGQVKSLFKKLGVKPLIVELDKLVDETEVQQALKKITRQSTVPNIFIGGKHIGGCDDTMALHKRGELVPLLEKAGLKLS